jgi:hypothetical protein
VKFLLDTDHISSVAEGVGWLAFAFLVAVPAFVVLATLIFASAILLWQRFRKSRKIAL